VVGATHETWVVLHEGNAFALDRVRYDSHSADPDSRRLGEAALQGVTSWPSSSITCQPKARHFAANRLDFHNVLDEAVQLDLVVI